jgi:hypothetical protein
VHRPAPDSKSLQTPVQRGADGCTPETPGLRLAES